MNPEERRFQPNPEVIETVLDDEATLICLDTKLSYGLNSTGLRIWRFLKQGCAVDEIAEKMHEEFDVERERARKDSVNLIETLLAFKLIVPIQ